MPTPLERPHYSVALMGFAVRNVAKYSPPVLESPVPGEWETLLRLTGIVTNQGPDAATNVFIIDRLPAGLTFVAATPSQGAYNATAGIWAVGTVTAGAPQTLQIRATVVSPAAQTS